MSRQPLNGVGLKHPAARVAVLYAAVGLLWIWLSDRSLVWLGYVDDHAFLAAAAKGSGFVAISAVLLYWLVRSEVDAVRRSDTLLRAVIEGTADAVFVKDSKGRYLLINEAAARFVGKSAEELLGHDDTELFDAIGAQRVMSRDREILAVGDVVTVEDTLTSAGGTRSYDTTIAPYQDATGAVVGLIGIARDITERKRTEQALRDSEARFRELADAIPQIVFTAGPDGGVIHLNAQAASYSGLGTDDLLGWSWDRIVHQDDLPDTVAAWTAVVSSGVPREIELRIRRADGAYRWHMCRQVPARAADGNIARWYGTCTDIDDLKRAKTTLRETEARLREAQRIAHLGSWSWEPPTDRVWWSDAEFELFGVDPQKVQPSFATFLSLLHPDDRPIAISRVEAMLAGAEEFANDLRIVRPDGTTLWVHSRGRATRDDSGVLVRVEGIDQDITSRRLAELAALESDERLQAAIEVAGLGVIAVDYTRETANFSARAAEQFGLPPGTTLSRSDLHSRIHPDDRADVASLIEGALAPSGTGRFTLEHRVIQPDGTIRWLNVRKQVTFSAGRPHRAVVVTADVTDRRQAEARLREQEMLVREAAELAQVGGWGFDPETLKSDWTPEVARIYGLDAPPPVPEALEFFSPEQRPELESLLAAATKHGTPHDLELQLTAADGRKKWVRTICRPIVEGGRVVRVRGSLQDITDRKQADDLLRESERRLRLTLEAAGAVAFVWDIPSDTVTRYFSNEPALPATAEQSDTLDGVRQCVHPDDLPGFDAQLSACLANGTEYRNMFRVVRPDKSIAWLEDIGLLDRAADGSPLRLTGLVIDVTDRVVASEALRSSEERLREAAHVAGFGVFEHDHRTGHLHWSDRLREIYGYSADAPASLNSFLEMIHPDDRDAIAAEVRKAHDPQGDGRFDVHHRLIRPSDGQVRWLTAKSQTRFAGEGANRRAVRTVGATIDVTDAREAAEALRASETRYRQLVDLLPTAVFVHADNSILYGNPAFQKLMGATDPAELLGRSPFDIVAPSCHDMLRRRQAELKRTGKAVPGCEMRALRCDGRPISVYCIAAPIAGYGRPATLVVLSDLTERERATELLRSVMDSVADAIVTTNEQGLVRSVNPAAVRQFGYAEEELVGQNVKILMPESLRDEHDEHLSNYVDAGGSRVIGLGRALECVRRDGRRFPAEVTVTKFFLEGEPHFTGVIHDITERKRLEAQFLQAQKMDAVGRLAGGVAHDFNNLLTIINGCCELLLTSDFPAGDERRESISTVLDAGRRAARLTQQLLAFSRKAIVEPKVIDLNELVSEAAKLLRRLIGEDIVLAVVMAPRPARVLADPSQLEQVIVNLAVNARDAMPTGGRLTIETATIPPTNDNPIPYVSLSVTDTGQGMKDEVKGKVFEPFFTTKEVGKGTGLGLAVVHGVVAQCGGQIEIETAVGVGTTFRLILPRVVAEQTATPDEATKPDCRGSETVLVVEDDDAVRKAVRLWLEMQGYEVLEANSGTEAVRHAQTHTGTIHLLVSDVVMPAMGGRELLKAVRQHRPGLRVLFMSGYSDDAVQLHGDLEATDAFIQKPFTPLGLARKVREVIDNSPR